MNSRNLQLYITTETPCGYFDNRSSRNLVPDPAIKLNMPIYNRLIQHGFRRSGAHTYRPYCDKCSACVACRLSVSQFQYSRSQRRCLNNNRDLEINEQNAEFNEEYFALYRRYLNSRHPEGSMANPAEEDFSQFLFCDWSDTRFLEFRLQGKLVAVAVTDIVSDGVSAVYSFFDPDLDKRSLGRFCILSQVNYAQQLGLEYVYLGYWIKDHPKMHYKTGFKPLQLYIDDQWQTWPDNT